MPLIVGDPFLDLPSGEVFPVKSGFNIVFVSTFSSDEPLEAVLEAAKQLPESNFYVTGNPKHKSSDFFERLPTNVICTGFLPDAQYVGLLRAVDAVMVLTTRDHTLQLGGCEAVSLGKPLITSNWPYLQAFFNKGTVYVDNSADDICNGILTMQQDHDALEAEIIAYRESHRKEWALQLMQLEEIMVGENSPTR
jgi:glycosyltransferase involved in cell wall biosynthesis